MERLTDQIVSFSQELAFADLPPAAVAKSKDLILDALGCGLGALSSPPALIAQAMAATVSSTMPATVLGTGQRTSPDLAAFANGVMIRYLDYNPSDVISAVLASTEAAGGDGRSAILGTVLAFEVLGAFADARPHGYAAESDWTRWDHSTQTVIAAAAVAARQLGLGREQAGHAVKPRRRLAPDPGQGPPRAAVALEGQRNGQRLAQRRLLRAPRGTRHDGAQPRL